MQQRKQFLDTQKEEQKLMKVEDKISHTIEQSVRKHDNEVNVIIIIIENKYKL